MIPKKFEFQEVSLLRQFQFVFLSNLDALNESDDGFLTMISLVINFCRLHNL